MFPYLSLNFNFQVVLVFQPHLVDIFTSLFTPSNVSIWNTIRWATPNEIFMTVRNGEMIYAAHRNRNVGA